MTRQKGTQRLNEIEEQRYLSSNSNSRFMMEQRCGNRYRTIHSSRKYRRYCSSDSLTLRSTNGSLIIDSIEILRDISRVLSRNLLIGKYSAISTRNMFALHRQYKSTFSTSGGNISSAVTFVHLTCALYRSEPYVMSSNLCPVNCSNYSLAG